MTISKAPAVPRGGPLGGPLGDTRHGRSLRQIAGSFGKVDNPIR